METHTKFVSESLNKKDHLGNLGVVRKNMWAVSRKRMDKHVTTERLILGNQPITDHGFHGYEN
jgi:hypothetical protein